MQSSVGPDVMRDCETTGNRVSVEINSVKTGMLTQDLVIGHAHPQSDAVRG